MWRKPYFDEDFENSIRALIAKGIVKIDPGTGICKPTGDSIGYDTNWLFVGHTVALRDCFLWHEVMFNHFRFAKRPFVPSFCRFRCYKVVVKPRNFMEAYVFFNLLNSSAGINADCANLHGKCGIDSRPYTDNPWGGFVYCDGLDEALEKYAIVRKLVDDHMEDGKNITVLVKRSCTEFEREYGPTDGEFWQNFSKEEKDFQTHIEDIFQGYWVPAVQPDWLKNKTILFWAKWANTHGDKSWVEYYGKDFLTMGAKTYHNLNNEGPNGPSEEVIEHGTSQDQDDPRP